MEPATFGGAASPIDLSMSYCIYRTIVSAYVLYMRTVTSVAHVAAPPLPERPRLVLREAAVELEVFGAEPRAGRSLIKTL